METANKKWIGFGLLGLVGYKLLNQSEEAGVLPLVSGVSGGGGSNRSVEASSPIDNTTQKNFEKVSTPAETPSEVRTSTNSGSLYTPANANFNSISRGAIAVNPDGSEKKSSGGSKGSRSSKSSSSSGAKFIESITKPKTPTQNFSPSPDHIIKNHTKYTAKEVSDALKAKRGA